MHKIYICFSINVKRQIKDTFKVMNGLMQFIRIEESSRLEWVSVAVGMQGHSCVLKFCVEVLSRVQVQSLVLQCTFGMSW